MTPSSESAQQLADRLEKQRLWLQWEKQANRDRIQKELGNFRRLGLFRLVGLEPGNLGKQTARLTPVAPQKISPSTLERMVETGALFLVKTEPALPGSENPLGTVLEVDGHVVSLAVPRYWEPADEAVYRLEPTDNPWVSEQIDRRLQDLIQALRGSKWDLTGPIVRFLVGHEIKPPKNPWVAATTEGLNASQNEALALAATNAPIALIQGPPGTGKTTTLASLIASLTAQGKRVLIAAPSNPAVDNLVEKCLDRGVNCLRMGHPARIHPKVHSASFDAKIRASADYRQATQFRKDARAERNAGKKWTRAKPEPGEKQGRLAEARALEREADRLEDLAREKLLDDTPAIFTTLHGFVGNWAGSRSWDWIVVDEAAQALESDIWPLLPHGAHLVLAGDPCQLPPTVLSREAIAAGALVSLMERFAGEFPERLALLKLQYRMSASIMEFPSHDRYQGLLDGPPEVLERKLPIPSSPGPPSPGPSSPGASSPGTRLGIVAASVLVIDTAGSGWSEERPETGSSLANSGEAKVVGLIARSLIDAGLSAADIGIITPYRAQAERIENEAGLEGVEIDSVDRFQGREKEAIILSLTRSNERGEIGFLAETRRTHVAITRAKSFLAVVGDFSTLASDAYYQRLFDHWSERGFLKSVWDEEVAGIIS